MTIEKNENSNKNIKLVQVKNTKLGDSEAPFHRLHPLCTQSSAAIKKPASKQKNGIKIKVNFY
jgi:hypothetical protein